MDLKKLFDMQRVLDDRIVKEKGLEGEDLLPMKILALQTELGECANEYRAFKFWSGDQKPRDYVPNPNDVCKVCDGQGMLFLDKPLEEREFCDMCDGCGVHFHNPLLEEYVDCLHFILSIGLEQGYDKKQLHLSAVEGFKQKDVTTQFNRLFDKVGDFSSITNHNNYSYFFPMFIGLGEMLGFTQDQVEQAYLDKNAVNHTRQDTGY